MFKSIFLTLCILMLMSLIKTPHALSQNQSWEGTYCNEESSICIEFSKQGIKWEKPFAIVTISSKNKTVLIDETELIFDAHETFYQDVEISASDDFKTITVKMSPYADPAEPYGAKILVGNYVKITP